MAAEGMSELTVTRVCNDTYRTVIRGHEVVVDQPHSAGGDDWGTTPTELFVASLATCVAFYAGRALRSVGGGCDDYPHVRCRYRMSAAPPWRVTDVRLDVEIPAGTPAPRVAAVERAISHCTVHNSITMPPAIETAVVAAVHQAA